MNYRGLIKNYFFFFLCIFVYALILSPPISAQIENLDISRNVGDKEYVEGEILVKYKEERVNLWTSSGQAASRNLNAVMSLEKKEDLKQANVSVLKIKDGKTVEEKIKELEANPNVEYAEPNYKRYITNINTDDTHRNLLWGLHNTGQEVNGVIGTVDADIDAPEAWAINEGTNATIVVAVIDDGVAYNHPDLAANMWDGSNCKDHNGNSLGDCIHGYDYHSNDKDPMPVGDHGTHIAGTIAAVKNNDEGIIGVAPRAKIMALKVGEVTLPVSAIVNATDFAIQNGAKVINASYGGGDFSQTEKDAIERFKNSGGIFVAASGNDGANNDTAPIYPAGYDLDNIISVTATDQNDDLASFSNYGNNSVHVGAPGVNIASTIMDNEYAFGSGTSFAAPHVSGLAALLWGAKPELSMAEVRSLIINSGDAISSLEGKTISGKRINAEKSLLANFRLQTKIIHRGTMTWFPERTVAMVAGDFNGDGKDDIAAMYEYGDNRINIWLFESDGTKLLNPRIIHQGQAGHWVPERTVAMVAGDFNGDGKDDIAAMYHYENRVSIWLFESDGTNLLKPRAIHRGTMTWFPQRTIAVVAGDFNGDGKDDIAAMYEYGDNRINIWLFESDGTKLLNPRIIHQGQAGHWVPERTVAMVAGDFNGDGKDDIAAMYHYDNRVNIWLFESDGTNLLKPRAIHRGQAGHWIPERTVAMVAGDFNGDGKDDIAAMYHYDNRVNIWLFESDGTNLLRPRAIHRGTMTWFPQRTVSMVAGKFASNKIYDIAATYHYDNRINIWGFLWELR